MKRDMDLIRHLLLKLEGLSSSHRVVTFTAYHEEIAIEGYDPEEIDYNLALLWEAGFVETGTSGSGIGASGDFSFRRLTWKGHDFVDTLRDGDVWRRTKEGVSKAGGWTIDFLLEMGKAIIKQKARADSI